MSSLVQSTCDAFEKRTGEVGELLQFFQIDSENLLKIKQTQPAIFERRTRENEENWAPLRVEMQRLEDVMSRYLDFSEMVAKETVAELQQPGSGIGKFGDYAHKYLIVNKQNPSYASLFEEVK